MNIYPAIDLQKGQCVRLYQGCYDQATIYENDPIQCAKLFALQGANDLHIIDLDGAKVGCLINLDLIIKIKENTKLKIQTGGGIRSKQQVKQIYAAGIDRVILGSIAILQPQLVKDWILEFGSERIVLALDVRLENNVDPKLAYDGWKKTSVTNLWQLLDIYADSPLQHVLCTDIERDGTLIGPNLNFYANCIKRFPALKFQASGGVNSINDLQKLAKIPVPTVIVGKALYEKKIFLREALK